MSDELHRHRHTRRTHPVVAFLRGYWAEILIVLTLALAIFLFFERLNIRATLLAWFRAVGRAGQSFLARLIADLVNFVSGLGLSELISIPLFIGVIILAIWRLRWRLTRMPGLTTLRCPVCNGDIHRVHRRPLDHVISWFVPVRRYRCSNRECRWNGLRVVTQRSRRSAPASR